MRPLPAAWAAAGLLLLCAAPAVAADGPCGTQRCAADISVSSRTSVSPVQVGATTELHLTADDNGPGTASGITIDFTPPDGVAIVSAVDACVPNGASAHCTIGSLDPGKTSEVVLVLRGLKVGNYVLASTIHSADSDDNNPSNDTGTSSLQVEAAAPPPATVPTTTAPPPATPVAAPKQGSTYAPKIKVTTAGRQRILKAGGLLLHIRPEGDGDLDAQASVALPGGATLSLAGVWRRDAKGQKTIRIWLGTTSAMKKALTSALRKRTTLTARIRVRFGTYPASRVVVRDVKLTR